MKYHTDNRIRKYVKGYGFLQFAKKFGTKYGKKFVNEGIWQGIKKRRIKG